MLSIPGSGFLPLSFGESPTFCYATAPRSSDLTTGPRETERSAFMSFRTRALGPGAHSKPYVRCHATVAEIERAEGRAIAVRAVSVCITTRPKPVWRG